MRKLLFSGIVLFLALASAIPCKAGPCSQQNEPSGIFVPDRGCFALGLQYEYEHFDVFDRAFHNHAFNLNLTMHLADWVTGSAGRLTVGAEGTVIEGFAGRTTGVPTLDAKSIFVGGGPRLAVPSRSRFEPWVHGLVGLQHFRFTQTGPLGSNSALGFRIGGGLDIHVTPLVSWRFQADYLGTNFQSTIESNYATSTGLVVYF